MSKNPDQKFPPPPGWSGDRDALTRTFAFKDFTQAFAFMSQVAVVAESMNHHPEWTNIYNKVTVRLSTHAKNEVTDRDIALARAMNDIFADFI